MVEGDQHLEQEVHIAPGCPLVEMHVTNWAKAQREDTGLSAVFDWLKAEKQTNLKMLLAEHTSSEEGKLILQNSQKFAIFQGTLYLCSMLEGKTEDLLFLVPKAHVPTLNVRCPCIHNCYGPNPSCYIYNNIATIHILI